MVIDPDDGDIYETLILNATLTRLIIHKNFRTSVMSVIVPYVYPLLRMQFEYVELLLLFLMASLCALYLVLNVIPGLYILCFLLCNSVQ